MAIELSAEQRAVLKETRAVETPGEFQALMKAAEPTMNAIVREVMEPNQPFGTILTELRDLLLSLHHYEASLAVKAYSTARRALFASSIRILDTALLWFGEGARTGAYRVRTVEEVVEASRPLRARISAMANQEFAFEPEVAELFADVNSTGTLDEERADMRDLVRYLQQYQGRLEKVGLTDAHLAEAQALLEEAEGRDLVGVLGLRNRDDAMLLRNRILTYAVLLAREARAAGINACFDDPEGKRRFEASSFQNAVRRLRRRRKGGAATDDAPGETEVTGGPDASGEQKPLAK